MLLSPLAASAMNSFGVQSSVFTNDGFVPFSSVSPTSNSQNNEAVAAAVKISAEELGNHFLRNYYTYLSQVPEKMHFFYCRDSTLVHGEEGIESQECHGQEVNPCHH